MNSFIILLEDTTLNYIEPLKYHGCSSTNDPFSRSNLVNTQPVNTKYGPVWSYPTICLFVLMCLCFTCFCMFPLIMSTPYGKNQRTLPTQNECHWNRTILNLALDKG